MKKFSETNPLIERYGITIMNRLERNILEVALDHMQEHLEGLMMESMNQEPFLKSKILENLEACKNLKNSLK